MTPEPPAEPVPAYGVDVSGHQTVEEVTTWASTPETSFVVVKESEGQGYQSPTRADQNAAVRNAGKLLGHYHFAWSEQDPALEVTNFLTAADVQPGDFNVLDVEKYDSTTTVNWADALDYTLRWLEAVKVATGAAPLVYANWSWIKGLRTAATLEQWAQLTSYPLWLAEPTGVPGQHSTVTSKDGANPDSWPILLHQYLVDNIDHDWTPDLAALKSYAATQAA